MFEPPQPVYPRREGTQPCYPDGQRPIIAGKAGSRQLLLWRVAVSGSLVVFLLQLVLLKTDMAKSSFAGEGRKK